MSPVMKVRFWSSSLLSCASIVKKFLEYLSRDAPIIEGESLGSDDLVGLMSFACDQDHIALSGFMKCDPNGFPPIRDSTVVRRRHS